MQLVLAAPKKVPIEFTVFSSLRMLGKDYYADDVAEILNIGEETARLFILAFIRGVSKEMYSTYVYVSVGEELDAVVEGYRRAGLPGCVGSMDCTHKGRQSVQEEWRRKDSFIRGCCGSLSSNLSCF